MSNCKKKLHTEMSDQGRLFDSEIIEGALDVSLSFRGALSKAISRCKDSRWQIAAKISELTNRNISKDMLDKYTSSNLDYALRAEDLTAFCAVTKSLEPFRVLLEPLGCEVVDPKESKYVRLVRLERENARLQQEIERLRYELGIKS